MKAAEYKDRTQKQHEEALREYTSQKELIDLRLKSIADQIALHAAPADVNWAYVGDLQYVNEKLREIAAFLTGEDNEVVYDNRR